MKLELFTLPPTNAPSLHTLVCRRQPGRANTTKGSYIQSYAVPVEGRTGEEMSRGGAQRKPAEFKVFVSHDRLDKDIAMVIDAIDDTPTTV